MPIAKVDFNVVPNEDILISLGKVLVRASQTEHSLRLLIKELAGKAYGEGMLKPLCGQARHNTLGVVAVLNKILAYIIAILLFAFGCVCRAVWRAITIKKKTLEQINVAGFPAASRTGCLCLQPILHCLPQFCRDNRLMLAVVAAIFITDPPDVNWV